MCSHLIHSRNRVTIFVGDNILLWSPQHRPTQPPPVLGSHPPNGRPVALSCCARRAHCTSCCKTACVAFYFIYCIRHTMHACIWGEFISRFIYVPRRRHTDEMCRCSTCNSIAWARGALTLAMGVGRKTCAHMQHPDQTYDKVAGFLYQSMHLTNAGHAKYSITWLENWLHYNATTLL